MKTYVQQSIWPVSVFGLGFLLLIMGLSGVASIQETRRIHEQILSVEDSYRHIENLVEAIRSETSRVNLLRKDRLLDSVGAPGYARQFAEIRRVLTANLDHLRTVRPQPQSRAFERLDTSVRVLMDTVGAEFDATTGARGDSRSLNERAQSQSVTVLAVTEELGKLNEETFESRRRALTQSVQALQNDIWETILTALIGGAVIAGASIFRITTLEKEYAEQQKATEQAEIRLRQLSHQLVSSQEQERKSLSRELHDEIGQLLTALRVELGNLERMRNTPGGDFGPHLDQAKRLAESTLRSTRDIAMGLRPAMLDILGLGPALEWQAREYSRRFHTPIQLEVDGDLKDLPDRHRTYLYRIVQEGLTNCARHAHAKNIRVRLEDSKGQLAVTLEDDGVGFDQHNGVTYGLGLLGITERVRELCGSINIKSEPGKGTRIDVTLPLDRDKNPANEAVATE